MLDICLINLPSPFLLDEKVFPPLGLLYVASSLKDNGCSVHVHDSKIEDIPQGYNYYGLSITTPQYPYAVDAIKHIKGFDKLSRIIVGGPHASVDPQSCIDAGANITVLGEGETSIIPAIKYDCKLIEAPNHLRYHPDRSLIDLKSYKYYIDGELATSVMTTKGCPYRCGFCCHVNKKVKIFPADFVLEELRELKDVYGYKAFMFFDDIFILDKHRAEVILNEIKSWDIKFRCFVRADVVLRHGEDFVKLMKDAGCVEVGMGVESGANSILKVINKGEDIETIERAVRMVRKGGIRVKGFLIVGLPSESWETIYETELFLERNELDDVDFTIFSPFKKSDIYEKKKDYDIKWNELDLEKTWYKGRKGEYESQVSTSKLSCRDIVLARDQLEEKYKKWRDNAGNIAKN
uniref:Putative radical SAM superfamily protein n=1 Tax=viral metagenome TaxID=1070528 RepID=A0A6M3K8D9_9ZZZZ